MARTLPRRLQRRRRESTSASSPSAARPKGEPLAPPPTAQPAFGAAGDPAPLSVGVAVAPAPLVIGVTVEVLSPPAVVPGPVGALVPTLTVWPPPRSYVKPGAAQMSVVGAGSVVGVGAGSVVGVGVEPVAAGPDAPPLAPLVATGSPVRSGGAVTHDQAVGQSASTLQVVVLSSQNPGKGGDVVQESLPGGVDAMPLEAEPELPPAPELALEVVPAAPVLETEVEPLVPAAPPPEHVVVAFGAQVKPAPQSLSWLQGSCHL
jgi:hypothetical protein